MKKVLVAMSGGVDSSTSAGILLEKGYEVEGVTMRLVCKKDESYINDAKKVASKLGINHRVLDLRKEFSEKVQDYFANEYLHGRTPNPCVVCNFEIKFGLLLDYALKMGFDYLATGHYAKVIYDENSDKFLLKQANNNKDQSYFLYKLKQHQLSHVIFPLDDLEKKYVREIAEKFDLPVAHKSESQDICFIEANEKHSEFISKYKNINPKQGNFIDENGKILGMHKGIINYTVGQRRHLGISLGEHMYVKSINFNENNIVLCKKESGKSNIIFASNLNLISIDNIPKDGLNVFAKVRSRANKVSCKIYPGEYVKAIFQEHIYFSAPGQSIVFYDDNGSVIGGATIENSL